MNLPNFYFADLPPEATLTPGMITAACDTLKRNREKYLLTRRTEDIVKILCEVAGEWLQPENKFRKFALERGPVETGFFAAHSGARSGRVLPAIHARKFSVALLEQEFGDMLTGWNNLSPTAGGGKSNRQAMAVAPEFLGHIAAGNIPNPALMSITLGLLLRSAQFVKCAGGGSSFLPRLFAHSIYQADPKLGACLEIAEWRGGNQELEDALFVELDCLTVTGSDEALAAVRRRLAVQSPVCGLWPAGELWLCYAGSFAGRGGFPDCRGCSG